MYDYYSAYYKLYYKGNQLISNTVLKILKNNKYGNMVIYVIFY
jgi:hypothetical protein